ncbi:hypothetical protein H6G81_03825 [Scytonema hofmannii FACHB-248]|uniref:Uncharacterized protein n=1 Tax=Scytonema hofmannii FACHB-248 TaxID=1842502 RepID=A0ABR8GKG0_9CYAN|nr:hypothetical protein [Scytonema hofmannii]MBD2603676.1 hypothetical protein [Scytonema hofmannii FACHB-248]
MKQYSLVKPKYECRDAKFRVSTGLKSVPKSLTPTVLGYQAQYLSL